MLQTSVLFVHVLHYKYYCFCSLDEAVGIKPETQMCPRMRVCACEDVAPAGTLLLRAGPEPGECRLRLQTHREFLIAHHTPADKYPEHWTNIQRKQTSTANSNSLPRVNSAEPVVAKRLVHHHPATSNIYGLMLNHLIYQVTISQPTSPLFP